MDPALIYRLLKKKIMKRYVKKFGESLNEGMEGEIYLEDLLDMMWSAPRFRLEGRLIDGDSLIEEDLGVYRFDVTDDVVFTEMDNPMIEQTGPKIFRLNVIWNGEKRNVEVRFPGIHELRVSID